MKPTRPALASPRSFARAVCAVGALLGWLALGWLALGWLALLGVDGPEPGPRLEHQRALALLDAYVPAPRAPARPPSVAPAAPRDPAEASPAGQVSLGAALFRRGLARFHRGDHAAAEEDLSAAVTWFARSAESEHQQAALEALRKVLLTRPGLPVSLYGRDPPAPDWGLATSLRFRVSR